MFESIIFWDREHRAQSCIKFFKRFWYNFRKPLLMSSFWWVISQCVIRIIFWGCLPACPVLSCLLFVTSWTVVHQAPLSMRFSRQEFWSGSPCPLSGVFLNQGSSLHLLCLLHWFFTTELPVKPRIQSLGWEDEKRATHCHILAWKIAWTEEHDRLQSMGLQKSWTLPSD